MIKKLLTLLCMQLALCCTSFAANYLTFTAEEDNSSFSIEDNNIKSNIFYSLDNGKTWKQLTGQPVSLAKGKRALLKGGKPNGTPSWRNSSSFKMEGNIAASGSVMSLVDGNGEGKTIPYDYCFYRLFYGCSSLTQAPELPATTLAYGCYERMFSGCTKLSRIKVALSEWGTSTLSWLTGVAENGTFICPKKLPIKYGVNFIPKGWKIENKDTNK